MTKTTHPQWTALIDDIVAGRWTDPETGALAKVPYERIVFAESLEGQEAELVQSIRLGGSFTIVADEATYEALGRRTEKALAKVGAVRSVVLKHPHADIAHVEQLKHALTGSESVVAIGSGTVNDLTKYVTALDSRPYCVFGTAGSMNGYTSTTSSLTLNSGLKVSLPARAPRGFFVDLSVSAAAPAYLSAAGFGDCLARSVAQVDWWMSHRLLGTAYLRSPFIIQEEDERRLNQMSGRLPSGDIEAIAYLYRVLTLCGLGVSFTGVTNHGSMGEHQISHYIDCFAGERHPGTLHGQQVGVASITLARLQQSMLERERPPVLRPTAINEEDMAKRMGREIAAQCKAEWQKKALDANAAAALNRRLEEIWPELREELKTFSIPAVEMKAMLKASGGPSTPAELGIDHEFYREAVIHSREMRNRFSFLDLAADSGEFDSFATN